MTTITLKGNDALIAALSRMSDDVRDAVGDAVVATALELQGDVKKRIQRGPATGRVYKKNNPQRLHRASAPGEAPMTDTGRLANSINFDRVGDLTATVGSNLIYALYLEYGTMDMRPRPYFRPAVEAMKPKFIKRLEAAIRSATR